MSSKSGYLWTSQPDIKETVNMGDTESLDYKDELKNEQILMGVRGWGLK